MVVPNKNLGDTANKKDNKKIWIFGGIGIVIFIVGLIILFKFVLFPSENDEAIKENDLDKILSSIKKEGHEDESVYGGLTEKEKNLKNNFGKKEETHIDKELIAKNKETIASSSPLPESPLPSSLKTNELKKVEPKKETKNGIIKQKIEKDSVKNGTPKEEKTPEVKKQKETPKPKEIITASVTVKEEKNSENFKFTIQVASFKNSENAKKDLKNLTDRKFNAELKEVDLGEKGIWYRLRVGKFKTMEEAKSEIWQLNSIGYKNASIVSY